MDALIKVMLGVNMIMLSFVQIGVVLYLMGKVLEK